MKFQLRQLAKRVNLKTERKTDGPKGAFLSVIRIKIWVTILFSILFLAAVFGIWKAYSTPEIIQRQVPAVNYQHIGEFDYLVYVTPSHVLGPEPPETTQQEGEEGLLYYRSIIDDIEVRFEYVFLPDRPIEDISTEIEIVAIVHGPSGWQKEVPLLSRKARVSPFNISFPLELSEFNDLINTIETELGIRQPTAPLSNIYDLVIEARVNVAATTGSAPINDTFVQPMTINVGRGSLRWDNKLFLSERKTVGGLTYKHQSNFTYTLELKENSLYSSDIKTLGPELYRPPQPIARPAEKLIFPRITDIITANFSYQFLSDRPVRNLVEEVKVTAILESPDIWSKTFVLVAPSQKSGSFRVDFSLDVNFFNKLSDTIRNEIGLGLPTNNLTIKAVVHTTADTDYGPIDEVFTQILTGELGPSALIWNEELESSRAGSITRKEAIYNPDKLLGLSIREAKIVSPVVAAISLPFVIYLLIIYIVYKPVPLSKLEKEARQAKRKHKGLVVDVKELPGVKDQAITVISLSSLDDLITIAENLFKPALHKAEEERHTYCVMDDAIRYEYVSGSRLKQINLTSNERSSI